MSMFSDITVNLKNLFITARKKNTSYKINPKTINDDIIIKNLISLLNNYYLRYNLHIYIHLLIIICKLYLMMRK